jgi:intracellular septation protein A
MPTLLEQMGGVGGIVASSIPVAVFVIVNIITSLQPALIAALVAGVVIAVYRIARRQPLQPAVSGLLGVGVAAFIAYRTGEARGFYLPGLIYSAVFALAFLGSVIVRRPLAGVVWHGINGDGQSWRKDPRLLRAYTYASLLWALVFVARLVVQGLLYRADEATWLGVARLAMGYPLIGVALLGTVWAVGRARRAPRRAA